MNNLVLGFIASVIILTSACNESTTVGSELILDEDIILGFTDTLTVRAKTVKSDPVVTYFRDNFFNRTFMFGELDDPIFGKAKSSIYFDVQTMNVPVFENGELDSMVFLFSFNSEGFYGDTTAAHDITIKRLGEKLNVQDTIFSDQQFELFGGSDAASIVGYVPNRIDSVSYTSYLTDEPEKSLPQIRMRMNDELAQSIFADSVANASDDNLQELINGFVISSSPQNGNSMIGLNLLQSNQNTGIEVYYKDDQGEKRIYRYAFAQRRPQNFEIDHDGSVVAGFLDQNVINGDPLFVQGMSGAVAQFDFSSIKSLDDKLLNLAQLEVYLNDGLTDNDTTLYPPVTSLALVNAITNEEIEDLIFSRAQDLITNGFIDILFGGSLKVSENQNIRSYTMNLTSYLKDVQYGREDGILNLEVLNKVQSPRRTIIYGPGHPTLAPKLRVTFTIP